MKFLLQRAVVIRRLAFAAEKQRITLQETAEFDMGTCYSVIDLFREAEEAAEGLEKAGVDTSGFEGCPKGVDIEMLCIAAYFHAKLLQAMGLTTQARARYRFALLSALSLDPMAAGWEMPTSILREKPWFMESKRVMEESQREVREAEQAKRKESLKAISADVESLKEKLAECKPDDDDANPRPLLKHLLEKHPRSSTAAAIKDAVKDESKPVEKKTFMKMMPSYHPDKNPMRPAVNNC